MRVSHHDVMDENLVHAVGPRGDHYRSNLLTSHPSLPNPSLPHVVEVCMYVYACMYRISV